jgi:tRNA pseudouridine32 synthase/23S rRNA pseudouridine746 synthase
VTVPLYKNRDAIRITAPVPAHMRERLGACGWTASTDAAVNELVAPAASRQ